MAQGLGFRVQGGGYMVVWSGLQVEPLVGSASVGLPRAAERVLLKSCG